MARKKLSAVSLPTLPPGTYPDPVVSNLLLVVGKNRRTWAYRYRSGGRRPKQTLGHFPQMGLASAREAARKAAMRIDAGSRPADPVPHPRSDGALTLGTLLDRYEAMRLKEGRKVKALAQKMRQVRSHAKPYLGLAAREFSKADLRAMRDKLVDAGTISAAASTLITLGAAMRWAAEEDLIESNPVPAIRRPAEQKRKRVLTKAEIKKIWAACDKFGTHEVEKSYARLVRFLLLTAQRRDEAASLKHGDILNHTWRQTVNKADRPHSIPLPPLAVTLVGKGEARDYVFPSRLGKIGAFSRLKRMLDEASGVSDWRLHDLRRTAATFMQDECHVANHIVQAVLNHSLPGATGVYLRGELEAQKREALAQWSVALAKIVGPLRAVSTVTGT
jgi:integrase